jgi:uncharacterized membrane protein (DUF106 family)
MADEPMSMYSEILNMLLKNQERIMISQKQIRNYQKHLSARQDKLDVETVANQQMILTNQADTQAALKEMRVHQKQLKISQDRLDVFFATLETIIANQDRIQGNQRIIIENQMKILEKIGLLAK